LSWGALSRFPDPAIHDPATVRAMCEDYRARLTIDSEHDDADQAAWRKVTCPVLMLWATRDDMERLYGNPITIWRRWAGNVHGAPIVSGHHIAEEAPEQLAAALRRMPRGLSRRQDG
jgi:haloacetate dehalogenase